MLFQTRRVWTLLIFSDRLLVLVIHPLCLHPFLCLLVAIWFKTWIFIAKLRILGTLYVLCFYGSLVRHHLKTCTLSASSVALGNKIHAKFIKAQWSKEIKVNKWQTSLGWTDFQGRKYVHQPLLKSSNGRVWSIRQWLFSLCLADITN